MSRGDGVLLMKQDGQGKVKAPAPLVRPTARQALGRSGERLAERTLRAHGYRILARNFRCRYGEIDLVAEDGEELVFVEVKTRRGASYGTPEEALTRRKQQHMLAAAGHYLDLHGACERPWRIDVVAVQLSARGQLEEVRLHRYAVAEESSAALAPPPGQVDRGGRRRAAKDR
jgi:putative endonuclease